MFLSTLLAKLYQKSTQIVLFLRFLDSGKFIGIRTNNLTTLDHDIPSLVSALKFLFMFKKELVFRVKHAGHMNNTLRVSLKNVNL